MQRPLEEQPTDTTLDLQCDGALFQTLVESVRDYAIFLLDPAGRVATWNVGAERIKGYRAAEIIGHHFSEFYPPADVARGKPAEELRVAAAEGRLEDEGWRVRKDGTRFWANVVITAVRDRDGRLTGFAKVTRDLTERRAAEQDRLERAKAEEAVRLRDEFLSVASHELRTPLGSMRMQVDSLVRGLEKGTGAMPHERLLQRMHTVQSELGRLEGLVRQLLDVSRITAGRLALERATVDLGELVRSVAARLADAIEPTGVKIVVDAAPGVTGEWDADRLDQVVVSLLTNAIKYGRGAPIEVSVAGDAERAQIAVRDGGIGIAPAEHARIFERFERAADASHFPGLGLGLWIVRQIVEAHGGSVAVHSTEGQGATFTVELPRRGRQQA